MHIHRKPKSPATSARTTATNQGPPATDRLRQCAMMAVATALAVGGHAATESAMPRTVSFDEPDPGAMRVAQLVQGDPLRRQHPDGLPSLLRETGKTTTLAVDEFPVFIESFADPELKRYPIVYVNFADRRDWTLGEDEVAALRDYLERGGFVFIDAGINAEFLRADARYGQHHSFADWQVSPPVEEAFRQVFPDARFEALPRDHGFFRAFYAGLPDPEVLPEAIRPYVVNEKWPQGTYSTMALKVDGRPAVFAMPIIAMGWGSNDLGQWTNRISFRVRESAEGLSDRLQLAAYGGERFTTTREDGRTETIYCEERATPAWVEEPEGRWRVFRYYHSEEISDYAHRFYTRLGVNLFVWALTE
ncbi:MAG: DUF4159 domain-containing protein [Opitutales bacterium]|nr:DUF4159 domain-containing protein [Opitutales bacterium]